MYGKLMYISNTQHDKKKNNSKNIMKNKPLYKEISSD